MHDQNSKPVVLLIYAKTGVNLEMLKSETEAIESHLKSSGLCDVRIVPNATLAEVVSAINEPALRDRVAIVHYAGHANGQGIQLQSSNAILQGETAYMRGLAEVLKQQSHLRLLFINGCASREQVLELTQAGIPLVIATNRGIDDKVASDFAEHFYRTFGQQRSIVDAFQVAAGSLKATAGKNVRGLYLGEYQASNAATNSELPWELHGPDTDRHWSLREPYYRGTGPRWDHTKFAFNRDSPYLGLRYFAEEDSSRFFGRDEFVQTLLTASESAPLLLVIGASGTGKSSVVRAGMIPHWEKRHGGASRDRVFVFTPQDDPFEQLATELARVDKFDRQQIRNILETASPKALRDAVKAFGQGEPWLFFVDQFEQIFTRTTNQKKRANFLDAITDLAKSEHPNVCLVLAMRDDFFPQLRDYPELFPLTDKHCFRVAALSRAALQEVIERPAAEHGVTFQPGLVGNIIEAVDRQPGALPLLQYALDALWKAEDLSDHLLNETTYTDLGGVTGSLGRRLQNLYEQQNPSGKDQFRWMMLKLVTYDESATGSTAVSRLAPKSEFDGKQAELLDQLVAQGLVVSSGTSTPSVQLGHEKIIEAWPEFTKWAQEYREANTVRQKLSKAAGEWAELLANNEKEKASLALWQGSQLLKATELLQRGDFDQLGGLDSNENRFLNSSYSHSKRLIRRLQWAVGVAVAFGIFGWWNFKEARNNFRESKSQEAKAYWQTGVIARDQNFGTKSAFNFLKAAQACEQARETDYRIHQSNIEFASQFPTSNLVRSFPHDAGVKGVRTNRNESRVLSWYEDGAVKFWDVTQAKPLQEWSHGNWAEDAVFTHDESRVLSWGNSSLRLFDLANARVLREWSHNSYVNGAKFTRDESHVLSWGGNGEVKFWDVTKDEPLKEWEDGGSVNGAEFTSDELRFLTWSSSGTVKLWDRTKDEPLQKWKMGGDAIGAVFTRDESSVFAWSDNGNVKLLDVAQTEPLRESNDGSSVKDSLFTRDKSRVLLWGGQTMTLWDVAKAEALQVWQHESYVNGAKFTHDESHVLAWSGDPFHEGAGEVRLLDVKTTVPMRRWKHDRSVNGAAFSHNELLVIAWSGSYGKKGPGEVKLWDRMNDEPPLQVWKYDSPVNGAIVSRDDSRILAWSYDGEVKLLEVTVARPQQEWRHFSSVKGAIFTHDDSRVLAWSHDGEVKLWDVTTNDPLHVWKHNGSVKDPVYRRDDSRVLAEGKRDLTLWELTKAVPPWENKIGANEVREPVFTRDESQALTWSANEVTLWDVTTAERVQVWKHDFEIEGASFARDGAQVLTWSNPKNYAGELKLWDAMNRDPLQVWVHDAGVKGALFSHDQSHVLSWSGRKLKLWDVKIRDPLHVWEVDMTIDNAVFTSDESRVLAWNYFGEIGLWDVTKEIPLLVWKHESVVGSPGRAVFTRDALRVLDWYANFGAGEVNLQDLKNDKSLQSWETNGIVSGAVFTHDESRVLAWMKGEVRLWDVTKRAPLQVWKHNETVNGAKFMHDESRVLAWSEDGEVKVWDVTKKAPLQEWGHERSVVEPVLSRDGSRVLAWSHREVKLWDVTKKQPLQVWQHDSILNGAVFSRDESQVLTWSGHLKGEKGEVRLWDVTNKEPLQVWKHEDNVNGAEFSQDESRVLGWSKDGTVKVWDVTRAEPLHVWNHEGELAGAVFKRDESRVLTWSVDGEVKLWNSEICDPHLTPSERILELEVRSASKLDSAGQHVAMKYADWVKLISSRDYEAIQKKSQTALRSGSSK